MITDRRSGTDRRTGEFRGGRRSTDNPHGTRWGYQQGCRCEPCAQAESTYQHDRAKAVTRHAWATWTDAAPAKAHLERLALARIGLRRAAELSGVSFSSLQAIRRGRQRVLHPLTAHAILAVTQPSLADGQTVSGLDSYQTRDRLRSLMAEGYSVKRLSDIVGRRVAELHRTQEEPAPKVTVQTWKRVKALHSRLLAEDVTG